MVPSYNSVVLKSASFASFRFVSKVCEWKIVFKSYCSVGDASKEVFDLSFYQL